MSTFRARGATRVTLFTPPIWSTTLAVALTAVLACQSADLDPTYGPGELGEPLSLVFDSDEFMTSPAVLANGQLFWLREPLGEDGVDLLWSSLSDEFPSHQWRHLITNDVALVDSDDNEYRYINSGPFTVDGSALYVIAVDSKTFEGVLVRLSSPLDPKPERVAVVADANESVGQATLSACPSAEPENSECARLYAHVLPSTDQLEYDEGAWMTTEEPPQKASVSSKIVEVERITRSDGSIDVTKKDAVTGIAGPEQEGDGPAMVQSIALDADNGHLYYCQRDEFMDDDSYPVTPELRRVDLASGADVLVEIDVNCAEGLVMSDTTVFWIRGLSQIHGIQRGADIVAGEDAPSYLVYDSSSELVGLDLRRGFLYFTQAVAVHDGSNDGECLGDDCPADEGYDYFLGRVALGCSLESGQCKQASAVQEVIEADAVQSPSYWSSIRVTDSGITGFIGELDEIVHYPWIPDGGQNKRHPK